MRKDLRDKLHRYVVEAAAEIDGRLPAHPSHPHGRIPVAHIYHVIQTLMERPARDCSDERFDELIEIVDHCVRLVDEMHVCSTIRHLYKPEPPIPPPSTLEVFYEQEERD